MGYQPKNTNGQATMANSEPVVIASDQSAIPVTVSGVATAANQSTGNTSLNNIDTDLGAPADAAATTDTGTFSLIALFKRLLSKITTQLPAALGQTTMAASLPVTLASNQSSLPVTDNAGSLTVDAPVATPVFVRLSDGAAPITALPITDNAGSLTVDGTVAVSNFPAAQPVTDNGGSLTVDGTVGISGTPSVQGDIAHDNADSGNPVKVGFKVETALPTAAADNDRANGISDRYGRQLVGHLDPGMQVWKQGEYATAQTGTNIWTPTASNRFVITEIHITTGGTTAGIVTLWGAATGTTAYAAGTDQVFFKGEFAPTANSKPGVVITPPVPLFSDTTNDCLKITTSAAMTVYVQVYGYEITP